MRRKPGLLDKIRARDIDDWLASYDPEDPKPSELFYPGRKTIRRMIDEELAEIITTDPTSKLAKLAESELRTREAWRGPARWSLIIAALAFAVSLAAFIRTF